MLTNGKPTRRMDALGHKPASRTKPALPNSPKTLLDQTPSSNTPPVANELLQPTSAMGTAPRARKLFKSRRSHPNLIISAITLPILFIVATEWFLFAKPASPKAKFSARSIVASVAKASLGINAPIAGQSSGRTNILIYGMTKDGLRTDSIILASYYWQQKKLVTLNIPRDLYVYDGYENDKMGEVYSYAKGRQPHNPNYPGAYVAGIIAKEYGIPINYWLRFNMEGEVQLIDSIGGITVNVPDSFTDYQYPTWSYNGYIRPAPHFDAGIQHMDGATALIFSRSRHSLNNGEGSDFARSKRQALVIQALMTQAKSLGIVGNLANLTHYLGIVGNNVTTSLSMDEMVSLARTFKDIDPNTDYVRGAWATGNGFLCDSTSSYGAYVTLYGVTGSCTSQAGETSTSRYRQMAIAYVQNLLASAPLTPQQFLSTQTPGSPSSAALATTPKTPSPVP